MTTRCDWLNEDPMLIAYHDEEWGVDYSIQRRLSGVSHIGR
jgi:DNA-3-methyladenine glycosylase I